MYRKKFVCLCKQTISRIHTIFNTIYAMSEMNKNFLTIFFNNRLVLCTFEDHIPSLKEYKSEICLQLKFMLLYMTFR